MIKLNFCFNYKKTNKILCSMLLMFAFVVMQLIIIDSSFALDASEEDAGDSGFVKVQSASETSSAYVWHLYGNTWYLYDLNSHEYQKGWKWVDGEWYFMNSSGAMEKGWLLEDGKWYYLSSSGAACGGWILLDGNWYYLDLDSRAMQTGMKYINGELYYMNSSGAMETGWVYVDNKWYYLSASGAANRGWKVYNGDWYYLQPETGVMLTGFQKVNGELYYMNSSGAMETGWVYIDNKWYYLSASGAANRGWKVYNGDWYYLQPETGVMLTGFQKVNGELYYMNSSGAMETGWINYNGNRYFANEDGSLIRDRRVSLGTDIHYNFDSNGKLISSNEVSYTRTGRDEPSYPTVDAKTVFLDIARGWIGYSEKNGKFKEIIDTYNSYYPLAVGYKVQYTDEWCDTFVSAVAIKANIVDKIGTECGCERHVNIFKNKNIWIEDGSVTPKSGDIIVYHWSIDKQPNDGFADHIGIVEEVENGYITVIEGNMDEAVGIRKIPVGWGFIRGFARPDYC
ncbi:CHAP domain-containing protein [Eubacteriales bacterium KG125]